MRERWRLLPVLAVVPPVLWVQSGPVAALNLGSMITPYVNEADMASINEAYSWDECSPWGFPHRAIDLFPTGDHKPFRAVADGTIESISKLYNEPVDKWQVNVQLTIDSTYWAHYAFEPISSSESDADLQLSYLTVTEGQTVAQGDLIGYLLVVDPNAAHVDFSLVEGSDVICPEPFLSLSARASILNILRSVFPNAQMCYGPEQTIPSRVITLDGDPTDWAGIARMAVDWENDENPNFTYDGDDLEALYVAQSADHLYLRIDLWENVNTSFGNGPSPDEGRYSAHFGSDSLSYPDLYLSVAYDSGNTRWALGFNGGNPPGSPPDLDDRPDLVGVNGTVIEMAVPLTSIGSLTRIDKMSSETVNCCVPGFEVLDETHCVNNLVLTTPQQSLQSLSQYVDSVDLDEGTAMSLHSKLDAAQRSLERDQPLPAINQLGAFIHHAQAQKDESIPGAAANHMIMQAEKIIILIEEN